jgi:uncharacterized protein YjbI with pentapeptide repeats
MSKRANVRDREGPDEDLIFPSLDELECDSTLQTELKGEAPPWFFENIAELSQNARTIHTVYVGFLAYCILTILSTPDRKIIFDEEARLPIINLDVPFSAFVLAAPLVAVFVFIYFQLHVQVLKATIHRVQTGYTPLEKGRLYPWMINLAEEPESDLLGKIQRAIAGFSLWGLLPFVLFLFTAFTLKKHDARLSLLEWIITGVGSALVTWLWFRYENLSIQTSAISPKVVLLERLLDGLVDHWKKVGVVAIAFLIYCYLLLLIPDENKLKLQQFSVDLSGQVLVKEQKKEYGLYWANLRGIHLERGKLDDCILIKADMRGSHMEGSSLQNADLDEANISEADLRRAELRQAKMENANLVGTNLQSAILVGAKLMKSSLVSANCSEANFSCADLSGADFQGTNLAGALLINTDLKNSRNLSTDQLSGVLSIFGATLDPKLHNELRELRPDLGELPPFEEDIVRQDYPADMSVERIMIGQPGALSIDGVDPKTTIIVSYRTRFVRSGSNYFTARFLQTGAYGSTKQHLQIHYLRSWAVPCL